MSASRMLSAPAMSRTASAPRFVGVASGALRRVFTVSVVIAVSSVQGRANSQLAGKRKGPATQPGSSPGCGTNSWRTDPGCQPRSRLLDERAIAQLVEGLMHPGLRVPHDRHIPGG